MGDEVEAFLDKWAYDIEGLLRRRLGALIDDLCAEDERVRTPATKEALGILEWLLPPLPFLTEQARLLRIGELVDDLKLSSEERLESVRTVVRATARGRGRPRSDTAQDAVRAYSLHLMTPLTWCEIAKRLRTCEHFGSNADRSCDCCGDAIRDAVGQLEKFLRSIGLHPEIGRRQA
jgi:hypothetical protein